MLSLTALFLGDQTANPQLHRANNLNDNCRPMYQLQFLFRTQALNLNQSQVMSSQSRAISTIKVKNLEKLLSAENKDLMILVSLIQAC